MNQADILRALNFLRLDVPDYGRIASVKGQYYYDNNPYYQKDLPDYHPFDYFQVTLSGGMHPDYVDERNEDRFYEYKITMQDSIKRACETQIGPCSVMMNDSGGFDVAFNKMLGESMKITRRQLRKLINETIFAGGPTVDDPNAKGVTFDMANQNPPLYRPQRDRDEEIRRTADPRIVAMLDSDDPKDHEMGRTMASTFDGKPEAYEMLTPEEQQAQSLYDEFYDIDIFDTPHDTEDGRLQRSYAPELQQIKDSMKKRLEAAVEKGINSYDELFAIANTTPGYDNLRTHLRTLPQAQQRGVSGLHGDRFADDQLMHMPGQLIDMYMSDDNPHY